MLKLSIAMRIPPGLVPFVENESNHVFMALRNWVVPNLKCLSRLVIAQLASLTHRAASLP